MIKPVLTHKLHIFTLSAFAFAQPLYDLLGKNAVFFAVRNNEVVNITLLTLFLSLLIPVVLVAVVELSRLFGETVWRLFHNLVVTLLFSVICLPVLKLIPYLSTSFTMGFVFLFSVIFIFLYSRKIALRLFLTYLSPVILIFPLLFLFGSQVFQLLFPPEPPEVESVDVKSETPIVMVVFDELPVSTLMSGEHQIDHKLFPGFASLAETSTWYPNTSTVADYTVQAIPALLTGNFPSNKKSEDSLKYKLTDWLNFPAYQYYPRNLFTALSSQYELRIFETITSLCPESLCEHAYKRAYSRSIGLDRQFVDLLSDLFIVFQHIVLPVDITRQLPRIDMNWSDFFINDLDKFQEDFNEDDVTSFQRFVDSLTASAKPTLYFHHTTLPHGPWKYLPTGHSYESPYNKHSLAGNRRWKKGVDTREFYQQHLLQTMFVDKLLSDVLDKLKRENIFNDAVIVVTADHGASFKQGEFFRDVTKKNYADIMDVPLFIKYPGQSKPLVDTTKIQTIDIVPILFSAINENYPWKTDGTLVAEKNINDHEKMSFFINNAEVKYITHDQNKKLETVAWKTKMIGNHGVKGIYGGARYHHLIGQSINIECARKLPELEITDKKDNFSSVDLTSNIRPVSIRVDVSSELLAETEVIAIAVNHRIAAVFSSNSIAVNQKYFDTMIDGQFIKNGNNSIDAYILNVSDKCRSLVAR